ENLSKKDFSTKKLKPILGLTYLLLTFYLGFSFYYNIKQARQKLDFTEINDIVSENLEKGSKVIAPMRFIFGSIHEYQIQSFDLYTLHGKSDPQKFNLFDQAKQKQVKYILLDNERIIKHQVNTALKYQKGYEY